MNGQTSSPARAPASLPLVLLKPSSQAPAASLKNSLYAGLHLDRQWSPSLWLCWLSEAKDESKSGRQMCKPARYGFLFSPPELE